MSDDGPTTNLLTGLPGAELGDVAIRRLRQRVLDDAIASVGVAGRSRVDWRSRVIPLVAVILVAGALSSWPSRLVSERRESFMADVFSNGGSGARWSRRISDGTEWIVLSGGNFHILIREHGPERRVAVEVPDGRIDDVGTVFNVVVVGGQTTRLVVEQGSVVLRLTGEPPVALSAGQIWATPHETTTDDVARSAKRLTGAGHSTTGVRTRATGARSRSGVGAAVLINDQRAEDEAYLNVIRLLRAERRAEAQALARDYLRRFPDGFRREEMGQVR